jgi:hypothetical protein
VSHCHQLVEGMRADEEVDVLGKEVEWRGDREGVVF